MNAILALRDIEHEHREQVGGKAFALARMAQSGLNVPEALRNPEVVFKSREAPRKEPTDTLLKARQLVGQPAGPGIAKGRARVVLKAEDLMGFKGGEILVCDALDPTMTFIAPLAAGIVERRGGMLIHGAIIAREYGLPRVTGVPDATRLIHPGDPVTVDGYLGYVILGAHGETHE